MSYPLCLCSLRDILTFSYSYYDAARYCLELKEHRMALLWAEKVLEVDLYCVGEDYPEYKKVLLIVEEMRNAVHGSKPLSESSLEYFMRG